MDAFASRMAEQTPECNQNVAKHAVRASRVAGEIVSKPGVAIESFDDISANNDHPARRKSLSNIKRRSNVFMKHKLKYTKNCSSPEESSSSNEYDQGAANYEAAPQQHCYRSDASGQESPAVPSTSDSYSTSILGDCQDGSGRSLPPSSVASTAVSRSVFNANGCMMPSNEPTAYFKNVASGSSSLWSSSSRSSTFSAEKDGSDSSDSLASAASTSCTSIKKLIRNKYDIFRRHKLKYRHLFGKDKGVNGKQPPQLSSADGKSCLHIDSAISHGDITAGHNSVKSYNSEQQTRSLAHCSMLHSRSGSGSRSSSSSLTSSSSSRDVDCSTRGQRERRSGNNASMTVAINKIVPLLVMVQRQMANGDTALMFKCNMCNMFESIMHSVLIHIHERHGTAQYCFDCEAFFPDAHSLESHRAVGCQLVAGNYHQGGEPSAKHVGQTDRSGGNENAPLVPGGPYATSLAGDRTDTALPTPGGSDAAQLAGGRSSDNPVDHRCICPAKQCASGGATDRTGCSESSLSIVDVSSIDAVIGINSNPSMSELLPKAGASQPLVAESVVAVVGRELRCQLCSKEFLGSCYLKRHMRSHTGEKICFCPTCQRGFSEWRNLRNHMARFHGTPLPASRWSGTETSGSASSTTSGFSDSAPMPSVEAATGELLPQSPKDAVDEVAGEDESCSDARTAVADMATDSLTAEVPNLLRLSEEDGDGLLATMHLGSTSSRLEIKSDENFRQQSLTPHDAIGSLRRTYHCESCNKDFATRFAMQRHLDFHADKRPFHCDMCTYKSKTKPQLKVHQMRHKGQKGYHCDICNYDCVTHSDLNRHCKSMSHKSRHVSAVAVM